MLLDPDLQAAAEEVAKQHDHVDLLINVTGILHIPGKISPGKVSMLMLADLSVVLHAASDCGHFAETALSRIKPEALDLIFKTNAFGPILTSKVGAERSCHSNL